MKRKEILPNLTINKCILDSIIKHHNTNTQKYTKWSTVARCVIIYGRPMA